MDHDDSDQESLNISDVIEVIQTTDPAYVTATNMYGAAGGSEPIAEEAAKRAAYVKIVEQPASKALRFRYECEGRSAGSIPGVNSTPENKTFPSIQIVGYKGRAVVVVSCVTKDEPYKPHPHNLVGKEGCKKGVCTMEMNNESMTMTFSNLGIQCVKKRDIGEALSLRKEIQVDPFRTGFAHRSQPTSIDLNAVRLCFQVFLKGDKGFNFLLAPVVSDPIFDKKAMSDLVICKLSDCSSSVAGGKEIILLCEKVAKEDIQVRFFEEQCGQVTWQDYGDFQPTQVHKQVAISFRTPRYSSLDVTAPVKVHIQLRRPSDGAVSEPLPFELLPLDSGRPAFWSLRCKALAKKGDYSTFSSILASNAARLDVDEPESKRVRPTEVSREVIDLEAMESESDATRGTDVPVLADPQGDWSSAGERMVTDCLDEQKMEPERVEPELESEHTEMVVVDGNCEVDEDDEDGETCRTLNELLSQVAELDVIYSDAKSRLPEAPVVDVAQINVEEMFSDDNAYSSLQLAMKNPIQVTSPQLINGSKREIGEGLDNKLPPLPPKRIKKSPPAIPTRPTQLLMQSEPSLAPDKTLPPVPEAAAKPHSKPNIFQKLFSKKPSKSAQKVAKNGSESGGADLLRKGSFDSQIPSSQEAIKERQASCTDLSPSLSPSLSSDLTPELAAGLSVGTTTNQTPGPTVAGEERQEMELTEAEHFALYTDLAPHATVSEFDEMSFYYSPVEGGKIVPSSESATKKDIVA